MSPLESVTAINIERLHARFSTLLAKHTLVTPTNNRFGFLKPCRDNFEDSLQSAADEKVKLTEEKTSGGHQVKKEENELTDIGAIDYQYALTLHLN